MKKITLVIVSGLILATSSVPATEKTSETEFNPFEEIQKMQAEMGRIFDRFHQNMTKEDVFKKFTYSFPVTPAMDLVDDGDVYVLKTDIPGVEKNKINISEKDGVLKIEAETSEDKKVIDTDYLKQERFASSYMRMITLPEDANATKLESTYTNGVLKITIPKKKK